MLISDHIYDVSLSKQYQIPKLWQVSPPNIMLKEAVIRMQVCGMRTIWNPCLHNCDKNKTFCWLTQWGVDIVMLNQQAEEVTWNPYKCCLCTQYSGSEWVAIRSPDLGMESWSMLSVLSVLAALCASLSGVLAVFPSSALSRVTTPQPGPVTTVTSVTVFLWLTICSDIVDKWVTLCVVSASGGTSLATDPVPGRGVAAQFHILQISNVESTQIKPHMLSCCIPHDFQYMGHDSTQETGCRGSRPHPSIAESCQQTMW